MATRIRFPTQQLVACARLTLRTPARPAYRLARLPRVAPIAATQLPRYFSSEPPKDGKTPEQSKKSDEPNSQVRPGWVPLTDEDLLHLDRLYSNLPPSQKEVMDPVFKAMKASGVPKEFQDMLRKQRKGGLSILDGIKSLRVIFKLANEYAEMMAQQEVGDQQANINKTPGEEGVGRSKEEKKKAEEQTAQEPKKTKEGKQAQEKKKKADDFETNQTKNQQGQQGQQGQQQKQGGKNQPPPPDTTGDTVKYIIATVATYILYNAIFGGDGAREITWQELRRNFLDKGLVDKLVVDGHVVTVELNREATASMYPNSPAAQPGFRYKFTIGSVDAFERRLDEAQTELGIPAGERIPVSYASSTPWGGVIISLLPTLLIFGLIAATARRGGMGGGSGGMFGFGKTKAKRFNADTAVKVKFSDVAGMDEAKVEIMEFVSFLQKPERFMRLGAKIPRGAILSGPPGTGKTLLAKATAGESGVPFYSVSGSEFVEMFVGVGASRVRDLFAMARKNAPAIIFIDEIDAIGRSRSDGGPRSGGNDEREATLNQILTEMDGFNTSEQVVVLAGTNRADVLDKALMRPGRFDRHIHIDRPTVSGRKEIFKVHLKKIVTKEDIEFLTGRLASLTPGFAGADIANCVNEAALVAARANADTVEMIHFEQAIERVIGGLERKSLVLSPEEKKIVAYHEAGHAICGWFFQWADPLLKVSIIPRGQGALGYAQYLPASDAYLMSTSQLMDRMAMTLGGRVAEELHFPTVTTGASDDFKKVTQMAKTMVTQWGMSEKVGLLHYNDSENQLHKPFAESTAQTIDAEVRRIVDEAYKQCRATLEARKTELIMVAEELLKKEMLDRDDMIRLLGPRQWPDKEEFAKYFTGDRKAKPAPPPIPTENTDTPDEAQPSLFKKADDAER